MLTNKTTDKPVQKAVHDHEGAEKRCPVLTGTMCVKLKVATNMTIELILT
jgi:hypothetical protein